MLALAHSAFAQQPPGAGSQLNQLPPPADLPRVPPKVLIEESTAAVEPSAEGARVLVNELKFTGADVHGNNLRSQGRCDHYRRETDASAAVNSNPLPGGNFGLIDYGPE